MSLDKYQKLSQREHILKRPDTYIGSIHNEEGEMYILDDNKILLKNIIYNPGLYKIYDEIVVNAIDQVTRLLTQENDKDNRVSRIDIEIENNIISVKNNGKSIPIQMHPKYNVYIPDLIFGELLTSENYDDSKERIVGGKNGLGATLTNIYSKTFTVEIGNNGQKYKRIYSENMTKKSKEKITSYSGKDYVKITFEPDYSRFGVDGLSKDMISLFSKRVYDIAACTPKDVKVTLNKEIIKVKTFEDYVSMYLTTNTKKVYKQFNDRWEVIVCSSEDKFQHVSFVNGICTFQGGKHVDYISQQLVDGLYPLLTKKNKELTIKKPFIKNYLFVFVMCRIVNPDFQGQTKEMLKTNKSNFGSTCELDKIFLEKVMKLDMINDIVKFAMFQENKDLKKQDGKKRNRINIVNYDGAIYAGQNGKSHKCTLILTEGLSAKGMAMNGLSALDKEQRKYFGVFGLKGKALNVRDCSMAKLRDNIEITHLKQIIGLEHGKVYDNIRDLRYGKIMLMCDQDSVLGDTPLFLLNEHNEIVIKNIEDLTQEFKKSSFNDKEYGSCVKYKIWTDKGWTNIKHVMRHKVTKRIFRILTHTGCVDVTEDHSLLNENSEKITPTNIKIGETLLHNNPLFTKIILPENLNTLSCSELHKLASSIEIQHYQTLTRDVLIEKLIKYKNIQPIQLNFLNKANITVDEAWVLGFFMADGSCGIYKWTTRRKPYNRPNTYTFNRVNYAWHLDNTNYFLLAKSKIILEKIYGKIFNLVEISTKNSKTKHRLFRLILNGGEQSKHIIEKYRNLLYYKKYKYIHADILNATHEIRQSFYNGFYEGDGIHNKTKSCRFDVNSKITTQCLYILSRTLNYKISINHDQRKDKVYSLNITKQGKQQLNPNIIKKIYELDINDQQYVYDLETENHHFQAGIGSLIVHNTDGFHCRSLIFNIFSSLWPSLFKFPNFLESFLTPIVKAKKGKNEKIFYSLDKFKEWYKTNKDWNIKYYKGLGTSTKEESKEYFQKLSQNRIEFFYNSETDEAFDLAFNKKRADDRKLWLKNYDSMIDLNYSEKVSLSDVIHKNLIHFSIDDLARSIPHMIDGLKISQRKILFTCFKRNLVKEIKVAQLAGSVSELSGYHHGEKSLEDAIVGMAQNFVGSNNINLLSPNGNFGSRMLSGKDAAAARYIFTHLTKQTLDIFNSLDFPLLNYLEDDGMIVEPSFYMPTIPMILVNGAQGIGTGFSTFVPSFNPEDIMKNIKNFMKNLPFEEMLPWYKGFKGTIKKIDDYKYETYGKYELKGKNIIITELPIGESINNYKERIQNMDIHVNNLSDGDNVHLEFRIDPALLSKDPYTFLKLKSTLNTSNIHLFNINGQIQKYNSIEEILREFYNIRIDYYDKRKKYLLEKYDIEVMFLQAKYNFINAVNLKKISMRKQTEEQVIEYLELEKYPKKDNSYLYLLNLPMRTMTLDQMNKLKNEIEKIKKNIQTLQEKSNKDLWIDDLN